MTSPDDRYLWDRTGLADPEVEALERLLAPLAHRAGPAPSHATGDRAPGAGPGATLAAARARAWAPFAAAAALLLTAGLFAWRGDDATSSRVVVTAGTGAPLATGAWVVAEGGERELALGRLGRVTLAAGSRVQVRRVADDETRLYLASGRLEARIAADARPRFFQVDTDAARCVDLGCRYVLEAGEDGASRVRVLLGQVAFEAGRREVFVPAGAECWARRGRGPGTPRFSSAPQALVEALDAFDAATADREARRAAARRAAAVADGREDLLAVWHWLDDDDDAVVRLALDTLLARAGPPSPSFVRPSGRPTAADREAFREHLELGW